MVSAAAVFRCALPVCRHVVWPPDFLCHQICCCNVPHTPPHNSHAERHVQVLNPVRQEIRNFVQIEIKSSLKNTAEVVLPNTLPEASYVEINWVTLKFLGTKVQCTLGWPYTEGTWLYCDYFIWCVSCTVAVLTCFLTCGCGCGCVCVCVCVCMGFVMCGCVYVWVL